VHGDRDRAAALTPERFVVLGSERTHFNDPAYGFRKLVDIAERGLAEPFQDPTTAVQAIDRLHDALRQLAARRIPSGRYVDVEGRLRLIVPTIDWDGFVRLAFDEIRLAGAGSPQVTRRLRAALDDLKSIAPPERRPVLDRQLELLAELVNGRFEDPRDIAAAMIPDEQGIGSGPDVVTTGSRCGLDGRAGRAR
jgi:uncharacterized membrane protein